MTTGDRARIGALRHTLQNEVGAIGREAQFYQMALAQRGRIDSERDRRYMRARLDLLTELAAAIAPIVDRWRVELGDGDGESAGNDHGDVGPG